MQRKRFLQFCVLCILLVAGYGAVQAWEWYREENLRQQCEIARGSGNWERERELALDWTQWQPQNGDAWLYAAEAAENLEDLEGVVKCLDNVPIDHPKGLISHVEKANLEWTMLNDPLAALESSEAILDYEDRILEVHSRVISFYAMTFQKPEMLQKIRRAIDAGAEPKESYTYLILADRLTFTNADEINSRWLAAYPDDVRFKIGLGVHTSMSIDSTVDSSRTQEQIFDLVAEAEFQLKEFLKSEPHNATLLTHLMFRAYENGDVSKVGELLSHVNETVSKDHMVWVFRGWYHTMLNQFEDADKSFQQAFQLHPLTPTGRHEYANLLRKSQTGDIEAAQKIAAEGKALRAEIQEVPRANELEEEHFRRIMDYARACGDDQVADALSKRLEPAKPVSIPFPSVTQ